MKVTFIITSLSLGGAETFICNLVDKLKLKGVDVSLIVLMGKNQIRPLDNINITYLNIKKSNPITWFMAIRNILLEFRNKKTDIIHANMFHAIILSRILIPFIPCKYLISSFHNNKEKSAFRMFLYRLTDKLSTINTNVSQGAVNDYLLYKVCSPKKLITMYNGIPLENFKYSKKARDTLRKELNLHDNDIVIINVGRFTEAKGQLELIHAFHKVHQKNNKIRLILLGDGEMKDRIANKIEQLQLKEKIFTPGFKKNISDFLSASDLFILSSQWEGFGLVLAEAMSCKLPIISTNVGGTTEVLQNNGIYALSPSSSDLADSLEFFLTLSIDNVNKYIEGAYNHVIDNFDIDHIAVKWIAIYNDLLKNNI
ncbi:glycosyltransferase [Proteus faecis]|uniref:glycosyltransferase n=1 Tax=Proteus faecis TaxID=2050967 RepID=UPI003075E6E6